MAPPTALYQSLNPYGFFLSLGLVAGIAAILLLVKKRGLPVEPFVDLLFLLILAAVAGGRAWYVIEFHQEFSSPGEWFQFWKGGLSFFGSLTLALPVYFLVLRWKRLPLWPTSDLLIPALPLTMAIFRLGCFSAGCCYGKPTEFPWGLNPIGPLSPSNEGPLHPTQLYEFIFLLMLGGALYLSVQKKMVSAGRFLSWLLSFLRFVSPGHEPDAGRPSALGIRDHPSEYWCGNRGDLGSRPDRLALSSIISFS